MASNTPGDLPENNIASPSGTATQEMKTHSKIHPAGYDFWKGIQRAHALTEAEEATRQGIDEVHAREASSNNSSTDKSSTSHEVVEAFKRRRTEYDFNNYDSNQNEQGDDLAQPLLNSGAMQIAGLCSSYMNEQATSAPVISGLESNSVRSTQQLPSYHGDVHYDTPSPFLSRQHEGQYYETPSPFLPTSFRANAPGFVPQTPTRSSRAGLGDFSAIESPGESGGVSLGTHVAITPHHGGMRGFQLPGLGAAQAPFGGVHDHGTNEITTPSARDQLGFHTAGQKVADANIHRGANKISGLVHQSLPRVHQEALSSTSGAQHVSSRADAVTRKHDSLESGALTRESCVSPDTPKTKKNGSTELKGRPSEESSALSTVCVCESSSTDSASSVWEEKHHARAFKMQHVARENLSEAFEGAFDILGTMNPDHYQMSIGSRVVCIKCNVIDDILMSIQTGLWACNPNVMARIVSLWEAKTNESEKVLLLWSVPGSKNFCGLAELQDYRPDATTDFFQSDALQKGAMVVHWLYCKLVPFDEVRKIDGLPGNDTVTQMWSGMHYTEDIGRKVIKAYVQAPHFSNLLAKPPGGHFRQPPRRTNAGQGGRGGRDHRGGHRGGHRPQPPLRTHVSDAHGKAPHVGFAKSAASSEPTNTRQNGQTRQTLEKQKSSENMQAAGELKLQMMPVFVHPDGSITPAMSMQGSGSSLEQMPSIRSLQSSASVHRSTPVTQTTCSAAPSSIFPNPEKVVGLQPHADAESRSSYEMPPPGHFYKAGAPAPVGTHRSSPSVHRLVPGYNNNSEGSGSYQGNFQPQTPARRAYHSTNNLASHTGSPLESTPRARGQQGQMQMHYQFHTPVKSPFNTKIQTPIRREEGATPRPSGGGLSGHRPRNTEGFSSHELRTNHWIKQLVGSPGKDE